MAIGMEWAQQVVLYSLHDFTIGMTLTSTAGSRTDSSAFLAEYGWMLQTWVSFGSDTWSSSEHINGGLTWLWGIGVNKDNIRRKTIDKESAYIVMHFGNFYLYVYS